MEFEAQAAQTRSYIQQIQNKIVGFVLDLLLQCATNVQQIEVNY